MGKDSNGDLIGMLVTAGIGLLSLVFGMKLLGGNNSPPPSTGQAKPSGPPPAGAMPSGSAGFAKKSDCGCGL